MEYYRLTIYDIAQQTLINLRQKQQYNLPQVKYFKDDSIFHLA